ncbi:MAG: hypothetical protein BroJett011_76480 [Chloroflexota bacterium]|nr:MAG: hypothetical protein BroJett011_76480 [Chloroflexota bacterium]
MARQVQALPIAGKYPKPIVHCTGRPETGKTQLAISFALWLAGLTGKSKVYVWPTDGREHEYAQVIGTENTLAPNANPLDVSAVQDEINKDLRSKVFDQVGFFSVDTVTHIYRQASLSNQLKGMTGQGSSGHALKAVTMMNVVTIVMAVNLPAMVITHVYEKSDHQNLEKKDQRESISETEEARWKLAYNLKIETGKDAKGYYVIVRECRERPGLKPFKLRDPEGGLFRTMPERIMHALYEKERPAEEPQGWKDFGLNKPFPDTGEQFKQNAVREMMNFFIMVDGIRFYAFGDPAKRPTKKNGDAGVNGAPNYALNTYSKVAQAYSEEKGGKNLKLGELTERLKQATEERAQAAVQKYLTQKAEEASEPIPPPVDGPDEVAQRGQPAPVQQGLEGMPETNNGYGGGAL